MDTIISLLEEAQWEIWYQDNFDRDCPRKKILQGSGLINGLRELWARHLYESVKPNGMIGFSQFNIFWKQQHYSVHIEGGIDGQVKLRTWVFEERNAAHLGVLQIADEELLQVIAETHSRLVLEDATGKSIINMALNAEDRDGFIAQAMILTGRT